MGRTMNAVEESRVVKFDEQDECREERWSCGWLMLLKKVRWMVVGWGGYKSWD